MNVAGKLKSRHEVNYKFVRYHVLFWMSTKIETYNSRILNGIEKDCNRGFLMQFPPEKFVQTMKLTEHRYGAKDFVTSKDCSLLSPGTYYLTKVDSMYRRFYSKKDGDYTVCENGSLAIGH